MIRGFEDDVPATPGGAVIFLGNRAALPQDLEERLLYRGSLLLRTRVSNGNALWPMTFGRSAILSESVAGDEPILIIHQDGRHEHGISADVDEIPCRLDRREAAHDAV